MGESTLVLHNAASSCLVDPLGDPCLHSLLLPRGKKFHKHQLPGLEGKNTEMFSVILVGEGEFGVLSFLQAALSYGERQYISI